MKTTEVIMKAKKDAVNELMMCNNKKISNKKLIKTAKKYGIAKCTLERAFQNFTNFGKVDLRFKSAASLKANNNLVIDEYAVKKYKERQNRLQHYAYQDLTTDEICELIHVYLFSGCKERTLEYLDNRRINIFQWYGWTRELSISGRINGRLILDYRKYGKINTKLLFKFCRARTLYGMSVKRMKATRGWAKKLTASEFKQFERASHILNAYL